jgi:hypothetical protein
MDDFKGSSTSGVYDVDCTADGKELCEKSGVQGYPTIKYGDPGDLKDYDGGRTYADLKKFADENLGPTCGPANLDLCDEKKKKKVEEYMKMSEDKLDGKIRQAMSVVEKDVPLMLKAMAWAKASEKMKDGKGDL